MPKFKLRGFLILAILTFGLLTTGRSLFSQCMMVPVSLDERISNASIIVEGRVIAKRSAWNADHTLILTYNTIEIYKSFKGRAASSTITITTEGGVVENDMMQVTPSLQLNIGDVGIFTLTEGGSANLVPYASEQGFIRYDEENYSAKSVFDTYDDLSSIYQKIRKTTGKTEVEMKPFVKKTKRKSSSRLAIPSITSISPTTASAGTYTLLTITGSDFGNISDTISFISANGSGDFFKASPTLIQSWSDTEITTYVPSGAGTGSVLVKNSDDEITTSSTILTITYNITNTRTTLKYTPDLINQNGSGGYTFTFNGNYFTNTEAVDRFEEVIEQWRCESGINWGSNGVATTTAACQNGVDGVNLVTFDDSCELDAGVLGTAYSRYSGCSSGGVVYWYVEDLDVKFDSGRNWNFTNDPPTGSETDFYSVMLHEMGHAHQLGHVSISSDVMYWSISNGVQKRTINTNNSDAVSFIMSRNNANELAYTGSTGGSIVANSCGSGPMIANGCNLPPTSNISANHTTTCGSTLTVVFTDQSLGSPTSWDWDFGDGNTSTDQNPTHIYTAQGAYDVSLTTSNAHGSNAVNESSYITVDGGTGPMNAICSNPTSDFEGSFRLTVSNVSFAGIDNTTDDFENFAYTDFSCTNSANVDVGGTYDLTVTLNAQNGNTDLNELCHVYIDYNNDGSFDPIEMVMDVTQANGSSGQHTVSVTIPNTAVTDTPIRMRVVGETNDISGPCDPNFVGDVEDYGVFINGAALPITLSEFNVTESENKKAQINWQTASETNNDYFTIERSKDGRNWEDVIEIEGAGNSSAILDYKTVDDQPYQGTSYYRLKQTDFDGKFSYSEVESITIHQIDNPQISIYPNPNQGEYFYFKLSDVSQDEGIISVTDIYGKSVLTQSFSSSTRSLDNSIVRFDNKLPAGFYVVSVHVGNESIAQRLIVQ